MKLLIDPEAKTLMYWHEGKEEQIDLYSKKAFELLSHQWLKVGWNQKHVYTFSWLGRPIIQLPEDALRIQEVIYKVQPDVIIETGVAHGGSLIYYASICHAIGRGRIIGVDIEIREHNKKAITTHKLAPLITLIEGSSVAPEVVMAVKHRIKSDETVLVILDSNHVKSHVMRELQAYHSLVSIGSYIVATDGSMKDLYDVPRGNPDWQWDNPTAAATEFAKGHPEFLQEQPAWLFNESELSENITHWPGAYLKRLR
ncbi:MAG: CmcI family methyltransferase [Chitinivibrionales bacterium]|nr:CmcI family methyltransferase [Chitinivibrionales bacterium]